MKQISQQIQIEPILKNYFDKNSKCLNNQKIFNNFLTHHNLVGLSKNFSFINQKKLTNESKNIFIRNLLYLKTAKQLTEIANDLKLILISLKGLCLIEDFYENLSLRSLTDLDFYVGDQNLNLFYSKIKSLGFIEFQKFGEFPSPYKSIYHKKSDDGFITLEFHQRLFNESICLVNNSNYLFTKNNLIRFNNELLLTHLIGHYINQHTFEKLFWLEDILLILEKTKVELNKDLVTQYGKSLKVENALLCFDLMGKKIFKLNSVVLVSQLSFKQSFLKLLFRLLITEKSLIVKNVFSPRFWILKFILSSNKKCFLINILSRILKIKWSNFLLVLKQR